MSYATVASSHREWAGLSLLPLHSQRSYVLYFFSGRRRLVKYTTEIPSKRALRTLLHSPRYLELKVSTTCSLWTLLHSRLSHTYGYSCYLLATYADRLSTTGRRRSEVLTAYLSETYLQSPRMNEVSRQCVPLKSTGHSYSMSSTLHAQSPGHWAHPS